jgi:hypothetical protein
MTVRANERGVSIVRITLTVLVIVVIAALWAWLRYRKAMGPTATTTAYALQGYAVGWRRLHPDAGCPELTAVAADPQLPADVKNVTTDPWGQRYDIRCIEDRVIVRSAGRDGVPGTADDIFVK